MVKNFCAEDAVKKLEENRRAYIQKVIENIERSFGHNNYDMAANYIIAAADNLKSLNGTLDYLDVLTRGDEYPEFSTIFD